MLVKTTPPTGFSTRIHAWSVSLVFGIQDSTPHTKRRRFQIYSRRSILLFPLVFFSLKWERRRKPISGACELQFTGKCPLTSSLLPATPPLKWATFKQWVTAIPIINVDNRIMSGWMRVCWGFSRFPLDIGKEAESRGSLPTNVTESCKSAMIRMGWRW